jgi:1-acyl-sn-glycerol-3-phosphate acyltransferase
MAEIKKQVYRDPRPAEEFAQYHDWTRTHPAGWTYTLVRIILTPMTVLLYRCWALGTENVPAHGGFIMAPNHFSNMDHFFAAVYLRRRVQFMAKSQLFGKSRILTYIFKHGGVFPVRRGHRDEEAFKTAHAILDRGGCVLIYAEGGRSRTGGLGQPRPGVGRLALESGMPVVPVAVHGSLGIRQWRKLRFPKVTVQYGEPISFPAVEQPVRDQQQAAAERIFASVRDMYSALEEQGRSGVSRSLRAGAGASGNGEPAETKLPAGEAR